MKNKLIVRISNGLGNQLFLYSSAYAISKKIKKKLEIDDESGFIDDARKIKYELDNFNITSEITSKKFIKMLFSWKDIFNLKNILIIIKTKLDWNYHLKIILCKITLKFKKIY